jgi:aryl-alcohol dehydrogenase-like predicted oxidoreductase
MTKGNRPMGPGVNSSGNSRRWIVKAVEGSLRRLNTEWIDVYLLHRYDLDTHIDETLGALSDLVRAGKLRAVGSSTFPPSLIVEALWVAERRGREMFACEQPPYSILTRHVEAEVLPTCQKHGLAVTPWGPLGAGWLSGRYGTGRPGATSPRTGVFRQPYDMSLPSNQQKLRVVDELAKLAADAGMSMVQLALGFVQSHPAVTAPIVGTRTIEHLEGYLGAAGLTLPSDVLDRIDEIVPPGHSIGAEDVRAYNLGTVASARRRW